MHALADNGGFVLAEVGDRLLFLQRRILPSWLAFVPGMLAVAALGNGIIQLALGRGVAGAILLVVAAVSGFGLRMVLRSRRRVTAEPLDPSAARLVIDLRTRTLNDAEGRVLAPLEAVRITRSMQLTSSARALRIAWPGGAMVAYRGDPFQPRGSIEVPWAALRARGLTSAT